MAPGLRIAQRAASEIERAERWWLENRPAAPGAFRAVLRGAFVLLLRQPGLGSRSAIHVCKVFVGCIWVASGISSTTAFVMTSLLFCQCGTRVVESRVSEYTTPNGRSS